MCSIKRARFGGHNGVYNRSRDNLYRSCDFVCPNEQAQLDSSASMLKYYKKVATANRTRVAVVDLVRPPITSGVSFCFRRMKIASPGQNATGQNATNSGICFFFQMLFQFVALPFNRSQPLVISVYHKLCFAHTT